MNIKKFVLWLFFVFTLISNSDIIAQPRVNQNPNFKQIKESRIVENPIGWCYNYSGKWCGYYGVLCGIYKNNSKTAINLPLSEKSLFKDNIVSLQFKEIEYNNNHYFALYIIKYGGNYDYPAIKEGWRYRKMCEVYLFTEAEYNKLYDLSVGINSIISFAHSTTTPYLAYNTDRGKEELMIGLQNIFNHISENENYIKDNMNPKYGLSDRWYVKLEEDNKTIRFNLPINKYIWEEAEKINKENEGKSGYIPIKKYDCVDFSKEYFEVTKVQFDKLIIR